MTEQAKQNKILRHRRTIEYFVDAAARLLEQEGIAALTIRRIAAEAGYSSASIYKYFESLEQLAAFAAIRCMREFLADIAAVGQYQGAFERYLLLLCISTQHSFLRHNVFQAVMVRRDIDLGDYFAAYYELYPDERVELAPDLYKTFFADEYSVRTDSLLKQCAAEGLVNADDIPEMVDFFNMLYDGLVRRYPLDPERYNLDCYIRMIRRVLVSFNPDLAPRIDRVWSTIREPSGQLSG